LDIGFGGSLALGVLKPGWGYWGRRNHFWDWEAFIRRDFFGNSFIKLFLVYWWRFLRLKKKRGCKLGGIFREKWVLVSFFPIPVNPKVFLRGKMGWEPLFGGS